MFPKLSDHEPFFSPPEDFLNNFWPYCQKYILGNASLFVNRPSLSDQRGEKSSAALKPGGLER